MAIDYEAKKEQEGRRNAEKSKAARDVAPLPKVKNKKRREACRNNLELFARTYQPELYSLEWSDDQKKVAKAIERVTLEGGLKAYAMPRGTGKTTIAETATTWASTYGHRQFPVPIGATEAHAEKMLDSIKSEFETNDLLYEDFPEVCHPVRRLEGIPNRCKGQLFNGQPTGIRWGKKEIVLPTIPGSAASGVVIRVAGLTGAIRGMKFKRRDGKAVRPDLVILDDPQTDESARSVSQSAERLRIVNGAVLGLAGPRKKISAVCPCTVICRGDLADTLLDRKKHPEWSGERTKMVYEWPNDEAMKLWDEYRQIRNEALRNDDPTAAAATAFYKKNRKAMDAGSRVAWPARFNPDELSALQHAMNLRFRDEAAFDAEMQQDPRDTKIDESKELKVDDILFRANGIPRGVVPIKCGVLTFFVDCHEAVLYWALCAWEDDFTGYVIDYGAYPDQERAHFALHSARRTLQQVAEPGSGLEAALRAGLEATVGFLCGKKEWPREDGSMMRPNQGLIDSGWKSDVVAPFCRHSPHAAILLPSKGRGFRAIDVPMQYLKKQPGERRGPGVPWRILRPYEGTAVRRLEFDSNYWKTFTAQRLRARLGDRESLTIFGPSAQSGQHQLFAEHLTSEYAVQAEARGNKIDEWLLRPNRDNHWWDCVVGCTVAASVAGVFLGPRAAPAALKRQRQRVSYMNI